MIPFKIIWLFIFILKQQTDKTWTDPVSLPGQKDLPVWEKKAVKGYKVNTDAQQLLYEAHFWLWTWLNWCRTTGSTPEGSYLTEMKQGNRAGQNTYLNISIL